MQGIFGLSSRDSFAYFDPDTSCWKTSQATFLLGLEQFSETWPDSGSMRSGRVYGLQTSELPISGKGSSSWPTALSEDGESCGNHPGATDSLTGATRNWPTAQAHDAAGAKTPAQIEKMRLAGHGVANLNESAEHWRTPDSAGQGGPRNRQGSIGAGHQVTIAEQAEHWQTPHGMSNRDFRGKVGGCGGGEFAKQANRWTTPTQETSERSSKYAQGGTPLSLQTRHFPTPASRDYRTPNKKSFQDRGGGSKGEQLQNFVEHSLPAPATQDGPILSERDQTSRPPSKRRLNPRFVEWLMNFPIGWTEL